MAIAKASLIPISSKSQEAIIAFFKNTYSIGSTQWGMRERMEVIDREIMRENDRRTETTRAKNANLNGDPSKLGNITIPVILPLLEAAVSYQNSVFLSGMPIFGYVGSPQYQDQAAQMQAISEDNQIHAGYVRQLQMFIRDGFKYNRGICEVVWDREVTFIPETNLAFSPTVGKPKQVIWEGNCIKRRDPYNCFWDTRVNAPDVPTDAEFAGYIEVMSRIRLRDFMNRLGDRRLDNDKKAFSSGAGAPVSTTGTNGNFYLPQVNDDSVVDTTMNRDTNWLSWAMLETSRGSRIEYSNSYEVVTLYGRIIPDDFGINVPDAGTPQIWKFIIVNSSVIILAERQTNAHNKIPMFFFEPLEDGLGYQTKTYTQNVAPYQQVATSLWNSAIAMRRRSVGDRAIYDPLMIDATAINSANPSAKIPLRPAAYGKDARLAYHQIPFEDRQSGTALQEASQIIGMASQAAGQNASQQGQFTKGNKTLQEYQDVMTRANGRPQMTSMLLQDQVFVPMQEVMRSNILQYQTSTEVYSYANDKDVKIDPVQLRNAALKFKLTDGLTPAEKAISGEEFTTAVQVLSTSPALSSKYNLAPMFSYLLKTRGADIGAFEKSPEQTAYEGAVQQWQQVAMMAAQKGAAFNTPQPTPQQFNYDPRTGGPSAVRQIPDQGGSIIQQIIAQGASTAVQQKGDVEAGETTDNEAAEPNG